jgi:hypothetical protein
MRSKLARTEALCDVASMLRVSAGKMRGNTNCLSRVLPLLPRDERVLSEESDSDEEYSSARVGGLKRTPNLMGLTDCAEAEEVDVE